MYLSNVDIKAAIEKGSLIVDPPPEHFGCGYDETSIDLHLDGPEMARIWDRDSMAEEDLGPGRPILEVGIGTFDWNQFVRWQIPVPLEAKKPDDQLVCRRHNHIIIKPYGFCLWQTKERIGTPKIAPEFICFINAKSTRARTGIVVHLTAPTIHAGWDGRVTLEICNFGPFTFVLGEDDVIAQLTVARISNSPDKKLKKGESHTQGQKLPTGNAPVKPRKKPRQE